MEKSDKLSNDELTKIMADIGQSTKQNLSIVEVKTDELWKLMIEVLNWRDMANSVNSALVEMRADRDRMVRIMKGEKEFKNGN